jgi:hypothetical protein
MNIKVIDRHSSESSDLATVSEEDIVDSKLQIDDSSQEDDTSSFAAQEEAGDTTAKAYDPPEQGLLSRHSTASLIEKQHELYAQEMEEKLWGSLAFGLYLFVVFASLSYVVITFGI